MKLISIIFLLCLTFNCYSQTETSKIENENKFTLNPWYDTNGFRIAGGYFDYLELEASYLITSYPKQEQGFGGMAMRVQYIGAGLEYLRIGNQNVLGAKLSYENSFALFSGQISADYLFTDSATQVRVMPKIGLSVFGALTVYYGWNVHLMKESKLQTQNHVISLQLNLLDW